MDWDNADDLEAFRVEIQRRVLRAIAIGDQQQAERAERKRARKQPVAPPAPDREGT